MPHCFRKYVIFVIFVLIYLFYHVLTVLTVLNSNNFPFIVTDVEDSK